MEELRGYDQWKLKERERGLGPTIVGECADCGGLIYVGDAIIELHTGDIIHDDFSCVMGHFTKSLGAIYRLASEEDVS
jgi:hypothetical protein